MKFATVIATLALTAAAPVHATEPVRIGVTTILSGPMAIAARASSTGWS